MVGVVEVWCFWGGLMLGIFRSGVRENKTRGAKQFLNSNNRVQEDAFFLVLETIFFFNRVL